MGGGGQTGGGVTGSTTGGAAPGGGLNDLLGGKLGETLGNLLQQGLGQGGPGQGAPGGIEHQPPAQRPRQGRSLAAPTSPVPAVPPVQQSETSPPEAQDNPAMNEVLRQLFNR